MTDEECHGQGRGIRSLSAASGGLATGFQNLRAQRGLGDNLLRLLFFFFTDEVKKTHCEEVTVT